jgi:hypothetical protein
MKPELGQIWWLRCENGFVPAVILFEVENFVPRLFRCLDLHTCTLFSATEKRWTQDDLTDLIGDRIC